MCVCVGVCREGDECRCGWMQAGLCSCMREDSCVQGCARVCAHMHALARACMCVCMHAHAFVGACVHVYERACVRVCAFACVRTRAYECVWACRGAKPRCGTSSPASKNASNGGVSVSTSRVSATYCAPQCSGDLMQHVTTVQRGARMRSCEAHRREVRQSDKDTRYTMRQAMQPMSAAMFPWR